MNNFRWVVGGVGVILVMGLIFSTSFSHKPVPKQPITVSYVCKGGNAITATYTHGENKPAPSPDQPLIPGGHVTLRFSDGEMKMLAETISADGVRYANATESFVFWNKGNTVMVLENDQEKSFTGCIAIADVASDTNLTQLYVSNARDFSIRLPDGYTSAIYQYQNLNQSESITGTKFTVSPRTTKGTNLASDTYLSIEKISQVEECDATLFLSQQASSTTVTEGQTIYSVASTTEAALGNRYEEIVFAFPGTNPCVAIRYHIHYGVIENYPRGAVHEFDIQALHKQLDAIRRSLRIVR